MSVTSPTILDAAMRARLACPLCKEPLQWKEEARCACAACGETFAPTAAGAWNFTVVAPHFLPLAGYQQWKAGQDDFERWAANVAQRDDYEEYRAEIAGVREIYTEEFQLAGAILDVGGERGRLRHFLPAGSEYLSLDPFDCFAHLERFPNLLRAYPRMREPCNFAIAHAERLPLRAASFDYVHMRSVIDHFQDPFLALCEARRVLKPGGGLMIGLAISSRIIAEPPPSPPPRPSLVTRVANKLRREGIGGAAAALGRRLRPSPPATPEPEQHDHHVWHPTYEELRQLLERTHFTVEKVHWQKPPHYFCVYLMARKGA